MNLLAAYEKAFPEKSSNISDIQLPLAIFEKELAYQVSKQISKRKTLSFKKKRKMTAFGQKL